MLRKCVEQSLKGKTGGMRDSRKEQVGGRDEQRRETSRGFISE